MPRTTLTPALVVGCLWVSVATGACGSQRSFVWVENLPPSEEVRRIEPGDTIAVAVRDQSDLTGTFTVRENGTYPQPVVGDVRIAGRSEEEAGTHLAGLLRGIVVNARATVTVVTPRPVRVAVLGEVSSGGQYEVEYDESVLSVIARAGGLTPFADRDGIYVIRKRPDLVRVRFRYDDLKGGGKAATTFALHDGDVIVVE